MNSTTPEMPEEINPLEVISDEVPYNEPITAGGCKRNDHIELTIGLGRFDFRVCPNCKLEIYRP
jgi:hypothetical protein